MTLCLRKAGASPFVLALMKLADTTDAGQQAVELFRSWMGGRLS